MKAAAEKRYDVVVVGEVNPDLILSGDVTPAFGQVEKLVRNADLTIGSSAGIFACGAARLGLRVALIGKVGADAFGDFMRREVAARGVDLAGVRVDPAARTGLTLILNRGSDRAILTYPGAIPLLSFDEIDLDLIAEARHLHLASYYLLDRLRPDVPRLFDEARRLGLTVSLDPNYDPSGEWDGGLREALAQADVFLPNQAELLAVGRVVDLQAGMHSLAALGPLVAVKQGEQGATALWRESFSRSGRLPVQVVDTVGAGDSFDAGFLFGYLQDNPRWSLDRMLRLGCVCGALSTRASGGTAAQPTFAEAARYLDEYAA